MGGIGLEPTPPCVSSTFAQSDANCNRLSNKHLTFSLIAIIALNFTYFHSIWYLWYLFNNTTVTYLSKEIWARIYNCVYQKKHCEKFSFYPEWKLRRESSRGYGVRRFIKSITYDCYYKSMTLTLLKGLKFLPVFYLLFLPILSPTISLNPFIKTRLKNSQSLSLAVINRN